jgi:hypothetical protein
MQPDHIWIDDIMDARLRKMLVYLAVLMAL